MITKRKLHKIIYILSRININKDLFKFLKNLFLRFNAGYRHNCEAKLPYPTTIMLELTNKCNLKCITCPRMYDYGKEMHIGNMDTSLAYKILDEALPYVQSIGLTGMGETLFAENLVEVASYIKKRKPSTVIFISTNANFPGFAEKIAPALEYIDTIQISTDGVGEIYESIRKGAKFATLHENIKILTTKSRPMGIDVMFNMVITKKNYMSMPSIIEMAHQLGVGYVNFTFINLASLTSVPLNYYDFFKTEEFLKYLRQTRETQHKYADIEVTGLDFPGNPGIKKCTLMWNHFQINHDGEVPPCCAKPFSKEYSFGNLSESSLLEVLNSPQAKAFRKCAIEGRPHPFCAKCHFVNI